MVESAALGEAPPSVLLGSVGEIDRLGLKIVGEQPEDGLEVIEGGVVEVDCLSQLGQFLVDVDLLLGDWSGGLFDDALLLLLVRAVCPKSAEDYQ